MTHWYQQEHRGANHRGLPSHTGVESTVKDICACPSSTGLDPSSGVPLLVLTMLLAVGTHLDSLHPAAKPSPGCPGGRIAAVGTGGRPRRVRLGAPDGKKYHWTLMWTNAGGQQASRRQGPLGRSSSEPGCPRGGGCWPKIAGPAFAGPPVPGVWPPSALAGAPSMEAGAGWHWMQRVA